MGCVNRPTLAKSQRLDPTTDYIGADAHSIPTSRLSAAKTFQFYNIMGFLWMLIIGLIVGAIAKFLMPGKDPGGIIITILIGIAGSMVAGFLGRSLGWYAEGEPIGFIASLVGAILLLVIYRFATKGRAAD